MRRRASGLDSLVVAALAVTLVAGCSRRAERRFRVAEAFLAENKPELAAVEYQRVAQSYPDDPLAAAAHYKLAYIYRVHQSDPQTAIAEYQVIAVRYPKSTFADDALQWIASISRARKDVATIREAVNRLEAGYADSHSACARARIQLALVLLDGGRPETKTICQSILKRYPDQPNQCAQAQLILGRALETIDKNEEAAVAQWEKVRKSFPNTTSAVEAQERIGIIWYTGMRSGRGKPAAGPSPRKRVGGVPAFATEGGGVQVVTLEALAVLLKHAKTDADLSTLMAVSGAAFQLVYDSQNRSKGSAVFATNPLETVTASYNFTPLEGSSATPEEAILSLCQTLDRDKPVMVPHTDGNWVVVVGYDREAKRFVYLRAGGGEQTEGFDEFAARWKTAVEQTGGALDPFLQFALGPRKEAADMAHLAREAARRGSSLLLQRTTVFGSPAGVEAYNALIADLDNHGTDGLPQDAGDFAVWADGPLMELRDSRTAAAQFFERTAGSAPEPMASHARAAAALFRSLAAKLTELHDGFPRPPEGALPGSSQPEYTGAAVAAAQKAREALDLDRKAADQLTTLASE